MTPKVQKRRDFLINLLFLIALLGLVYVFFKYVFWAAAPFLLTFLFAAILQKPLRWLDKKTKDKMHAFWSVALVFLSICIILVPLIFLLAEVVDKIVDFAKYLIGLMSDMPTFIATLEKELIDFGKFLPDAIYKSYSETITEWCTGLLDSSNGSSATSMLSNIDFSKISSGISSGISGVFGVVKSLPSILIGTVITIIAWIFFTKDYKFITTFIKRQLPEGKGNIFAEIKQVFSKTILKMFKAYSLILLITFFELFLGFAIMRLLGVMENRYYIWIAIGTALFDILPVAGSGGVLIPWALFSLIMGNYQQAIGLIIMYIIISVIREYIEPKIVGESLGVNPIITLMGFYFGLKLFGFMGMFIVPIGIMVLKALNDTGRIHLWNTIERN